MTDNIKMLKSLFSFHTFIKAFDRKLQSDPKPCWVTHQSCSCIPAAFLSLARSLSTDWKSQLTVEIYLLMDQMTRHLLIISIAVFITIITIVIKIIITPSKPRSLNTDWNPSLPPSAIYLDHHIPPHHRCCQPMYDV